MIRGREMPGSLTQPLPQGVELHKIFSAVLGAAGRIGHSVEKKETFSARGEKGEERQQLHSQQLSHMYVSS